jgi:hypothetical protein
MDALPDDIRRELVQSGPGFRRASKWYLRAHDELLPDLVKRAYDASYAIYSPDQSGVPYHACEYSVGRETFIGSFEDILRLGKTGSLTADTRAFYHRVEIGGYALLNVQVEKVDLVNKTVYHLECACGPSQLDKYIKAVSSAPERAPGLDQALADLIGSSERWRVYTAGAAPCEYVMTPGSATIYRGKLEYNHRYTLGKYICTR